MNDNKIAIIFGPDKSQILRGIAIIFMIILHNHVSGLFKICVPIFTFLVGYGYAFAKQRNLAHASKRCWHLLSHFWLILLGICLPVGILTGGFKPTISNVLPELFGLDSQLNWYSWYVYFYIWAMIVMIPCSRIIKRWKISGIVGLCIVCVAGCVIIHQFKGWDNNIWLKALFDCFLCSPPMFTGFYLAVGGGSYKIRIRKNTFTAVGLLILATAIFFFRGINYASFLDFITVPVFCLSVVALFNIITNIRIHRFFIALGKESMNMWFIHALFATTCTAVVFAPLIMWIPNKPLLIIVMIAVSYCMSKIISKIYDTINK